MEKCTLYIFCTELLRDSLALGCIFVLGGEGGFYSIHGARVSTETWCVCFNFKFHVVHASIAQSPPWTYLP